jgi:hypothetical protein
MAQFPELEPATRSYDFGLFPLTEEPSISAGIVRFRHGTTATNHQLTLSYEYLTDAEATLIRSHFHEQGGGYRSFLLPPIIWRGHSFTGNVVPPNTRWRYIEAPEEEHLKGGYVNVTVTLGSDGTIDTNPEAVQASLITRGAGGGTPGATLTVTAGLESGAATGA